QAVRVRRHDHALEEVAARLEADDSGRNVRAACERVGQSERLEIVRRGDVSELVSLGHDEIAALADLLECRTEAAEKRRARVEVEDGVRLEVREDPRLPRESQVPVRRE